MIIRLKSIFWILAFFVSLNTSLISMEGQDRHFHNLKHDLKVRLHKIFPNTFTVDGYGEYKLGTKGHMNFAIDEASGGSISYWFEGMKGDETHPHLTIVNQSWDPKSAPLEFHVTFPGGKRIRYTYDGNYERKYEKNVEHSDDTKEHDEIAETIAKAFIESLKILD